MALGQWPTVMTLKTCVMFQVNNFGGCGDRIAPKTLTKWCSGEKDSSPKSQAEQTIHLVVELSKYFCSKCASYLKMVYSADALTYDNNFCNFLASSLQCEMY